MRRFTIQGKGGHLSALEFGRAGGPIDVVFLHATGFCAQTYRHLLEPMGPQRRVVALDLRGHGHCTLPARPARLSSWATYADDVIPALEQLAGDERPPRVLAGHSMGATVSMLALSRRPGLADSLLMIDPPLVLPEVRRWLLLPFGTEVWRRRQPLARSATRRRAEFPGREAVLKSYRGRGAFRTWSPGFLEDYVEGGFMAAPGGTVRLRCSPEWESATFAAQRHDLRAALSALRVRSMMLVPEHGSTAEKGLPLVRSLAPHVSIERIPATSHFLPMERPDLVRDYLDRMLGAGERAEGDSPA
ncbi:MAG: hypothetical protein RIS35_2627 [Pseudomonadota bacterium]|jgi:pimeloyl-ACP methyl ester carboxylesterase